MNYVTKESFLYFMPGLARLALGKGDDYYLGQLLFHLDCRLESLSQEQKNALWTLLNYLFETMPEEIEQEIDEDYLFKVMENFTDNNPC